MWWDKQRSIRSHGAVRNLFEKTRSCAALCTMRRGLGRRGAEWSRVMTNDHSAPRRPRPLRMVHNAAQLLVFSNKLRTAPWLLMDLCLSHHIYSARMGQPRNDCVSDLW